MKTLPEIERILRDQKPILKEKFKVREIGIFGSVVRCEQKETSDLDLLVEFEEPIGLIKYVELQNYLSDRIGARVDLVMKSGLKPGGGALAKQLNPAPLRTVRHFERNIFEF